MAQITLSAGINHVSSGQEADNYRYGSGTQIYVYSGGAAVADSLYGGGVLEILAGGSAVNIIVSSGSNADISGSAIGTVISSGGKELVWSGGSAQSSTVSNGGTQYVFSSGVAGATIVSSGGELAVESGGTALAPTVLDGGNMDVLPAGVQSGGALFGTAYETVKGTTFGVVLHSGATQAVTYGVASGTIVQSGAAQQLLVQATAVDTHVLAGGSLTIFDAASVASGTEVDSGGLLRVVNGSGSVGATVSSGGVLLTSSSAPVSTTLLAGGTIDLRGLSYVSGATATLTSGTDVLTISEGGMSTTLQMAGSYANEHFVAGADGFGGTLVTLAADAATGATSTLSDTIGDSVTLPDLSAATHVASSALSSLVISGIPIGDELWDSAGHVFVASTGATSVDIASWRLAALMLTPHNTQNAQLTATATDSTGLQGVASTLDLKVIPGAPYFEWSPVGYAGHGVPIALDTPAYGLQVNLDYIYGAGGTVYNKGPSDTIGTVTLAGLPQGSLLTDGSHTFTATLANPIADISGWNWSALTIDVPTAGTYTLTVSATEVDSEGDVGSLASLQRDLTVDPGPTAANGAITVGHGMTEPNLTDYILSLVTPGLGPQTFDTITAASGNASVTNGYLSYKAPAVGPDSFTYTVTDNYGDSATGMIAVTVDPGPTVTASGVTRLAPGKTVTLATVTPGIAGDTLRLTEQLAPSGVLALAGDKVVFTLSTSSLTSISNTVEYTISDQYGDSVYQSDPIQLDFGPRVTNGTLLVGPGETLDVTRQLASLVRPGLSGDTETVTAVSGNASVLAGAVSYTAPSTGGDSFTFTVTDQLGNTASGSVAVSVDPGPTAADGVLKLRPGQTKNIADALKALVTPGSQGETETLVAVTGDASLSGVTVSYTAPASGTDSIGYTVRNQFGQASSGALTIEVDPGPVASHGTLIIGRGQSEDISAMLLGLAVPGLPGDVETISSVTSTTVSGGHVVVSQGSIIYTAPALLPVSGMDMLTYTVTDQLGGMATGTVAFTLVTNPVVYVAAGTSALVQANMSYVGGGNDQFYVTPITIADTIDGGGNNSSLGVLNGGTSVMGANITGFGQVHLMGGTAGTTGFNFTANATQGLTVVGSLGNDVITVGDASQTIITEGLHSVVKATAATAGAVVAGVHGNPTLEITGGGSATLNAGDGHGMIVQIDQAMILNLGLAAFISAVAETSGSTVTAGAPFQTLVTLAGGTTFVGATARNTYADTLKGSSVGLNGDTFVNFGKSDAIDITDVLPSSSIVFTQNSGTQGALSFGGSSVTLLGVFDPAKFQMASDGGAGTMVTYLG